MKYQVIVWIIVLLSGCSTQKLDKKYDTRLQIQYVVSGAVTDSSAVVLIKGNATGLVNVKLIESESAKHISNHFISISDSIALVTKIRFKNLLPNTRYTYQVSYDKHLSQMLGGYFSTMSDLPASYRFAFGGCAETGSESEIFTRIKSERPKFFLHLGDLHYENIDNDCTSRFITAYHKVFNSATQSDLYRNVPLIYLWDDHDFGPNNSAADNPCRKEAVAMYQKFIPHYPLAFRDENGPISQYFESGRVAFLMTDLRSQKIRPEYDQCERIKIGTNFGSEQHLQWFFSMMKAAKDRGKAIVWISSYPWINAPGGPNYKCNENDNWGGYPEERQRIADFIKDNNIPVAILSGDAHMVAMDDGTNSDYATGGGAPVRIFQAAALDRPGSYKGGPYSHGYNTTPGQFGIVDVIDDGGDKVCFKWHAKNVEGSPVLNHKNLPISMEFCLNLHVRQ